MTGVMEETAGPDDRSATALPADYEGTRHDLQRVATHILARARAAATGRFGLRVTWDGIATPMFGDRGEVLRMSGTRLVHEWQGEEGARTTSINVDGMSLTELADFAGLDLTEPFEAGADSPPVGDPSAPLALGTEAVDLVFGWYRLGASTFDRVLPRLVETSVMQLWPEHFDLGLDGGTAGGRVNLGASPGDAGIGQPYLYVGPWEEERPGDPGYWNAPFGAVLTHADLTAAPDPSAAATAFLLRGLDLLG
jgi:hypothetical protein